MRALKPLIAALSLTISFTALADTQVSIDTTAPGPVIN